MAVAKVILNGTTLIDVTQKTVTSSSMLNGTTALKNDGTDITGSIQNGSATTPATTITANPSISVDSSGLITSSVTESQSITPTVSAGYITNGTSGTVSVSGSNTSQLATQSGTTITPTESEQTAVASYKYTTGDVKIGAISPTYVGSGITRRDSTDLTESGATVSVPSGYYAESASKSVASGVEGTPVATKGTVSNNSISVTPSVTNTTGYITGGTITGTDVTVSASELVSGTIPITSAGTTDVTNYASASVASGTEGTPVAIKGLVSRTSVSVTPTVTNVGGFISGGTHTGTAVLVTASELVSGTIAITSAGTTDVTAYASASVASGSATTPATSITANPSISVNASGLITASVSASKSVTPTVSAGYVSSGTSGTVSVSGSNTSQLTTQGATTITPSTSSQTAVASGTYTTGAITVDPIPSQYIVPTGTVNITSNGTVDVTQYASASVNVPTGAVSAPYNDVNFYDDYNGTIAYSYSAAEFAALSAMPANPTHSGMTSQGWNWTLADAKAQLQATGYLSIGQMYVTSDGKTRAYITIPNNLRKTVRVNWYQTVANSVSVDFGDGSSAVTASGTGNKNAVHEYATDGDYIISLTVTSGTMKLGNGGNSTTLIQSGESTVRYPYCAMLRRVELGSNVTDININSLYNSFLMETITMPNTITSIGNNAFYASYSIRHITIPSSCTSIGEGAFRTDRSLLDISFPKQLTSIGASALRDFPITNISLPPITAITEYMMASATILTSIVVPSTVTSIAANAFNGNTGVREYHFKSTTPPTLANDNVFTSIPSDCIIYVPSASLSAYQTAWATYASKMVGE